MLAVSGERVPELDGGVGIHEVQLAKGGDVLIGKMALDALMNSANGAGEGEVVVRNGEGAVGKVQAPRRSD